jgi:hypothetical protein
MRRQMLRGEQDAPEPGRHLVVSRWTSVRNTVSAAPFSRQGIQSGRLLVDGRGGPTDKGT